MSRSGHRVARVRPVESLGRRCAYCEMVPRASLHWVEDDRPYKLLSCAGHAIRFAERAGVPVPADLAVSADLPAPADDAVFVEHPEYVHAVRVLLGRAGALVRELTMDHFCLPRPAEREQLAARLAELVAGVRQVLLAHDAAASGMDWAELTELHGCGSQPRARAIAAGGEALVHRLRHESTVEESV